MKKGFTLIEMLVILVFLSIISLMAVPNVTNLLKKSDNDKYQVFLSNVFLATEAYIEKYKDDYPSLSMEDSTTYVYMKDLVDEKLISTNLVNPNYCVDGVCNSKKISTCSNKSCSIDDYTIIVTKDDAGRYKYELANELLKDDPESFSTDSWKVIIKAAKENNTSAYQIGDTKEVDMGEFGKHTLRIANMSTPSECSSNGFSETACGFVLEFEDIITIHDMNPKTETKNYGINIGGWPATSMRQYVNSDIYNSLPSDLKSGIIDTLVVSGHGKTSGETNFTSTDKLYLLSTKEVWGKEGTSNMITRDTAEEETRQLDYYKKNGITTKNYPGTRKKLNGSLEWWSLRSSYDYDDQAFYTVNAGGDWNYRPSHYSLGVSPAFRIG